MKKPLLKVIGCYLLAGALFLLYLEWPDYRGHAHIPFSSFPGFLLLAPIAPLVLFEEFSISGALVYGIALAASLWLAFRNRQSPKKPSVGGFAWALLFLSGGRMPPPPPPSQIEQEAGERKNREIGRDEES